MYYVTVTQQAHTDVIASRIDRAVKAIHPDLAWVGPVNLPGNSTRGWLERPNDGANDYGYRITENAHARATAHAILGGAR